MPSSNRRCASGVCRVGSKLVLEVILGLRWSGPGTSLTPASRRCPIISIYLVGISKRLFRSSSCAPHFMPQLAPVRIVPQRIAEGARIEHQAARVIGAGELAADLAARFALAILAPAIGVAREAGEGRQRAFEQAQDLAETHGICGPQHHIAAALAPAAVEHAGLLEIEQDLFEELVRDRMALGDRGAGQGIA